MADIDLGKKERYNIRGARCSLKGWDKCDDINTSRPNGLVIGDSHAIDALNMIDSIYPDHNLVMSAKSGCPPHNDIESLLSTSYQNAAACGKVNRFRYDLAELRKFDYIIINVYFSWYTRNHFEPYLKFLKKHGIDRVIVVGGYYYLLEELPELINRFGFSESIINSYLKETVVSDPELKQLTEEYDYLFLSKRDAFCPENRCQFLDENDLPFTYDRHHLSYDFSRKLANFHRRTIMNYTGLIPDPLEIEAQEFNVIDWGPKTWISNTTLDSGENGGAIIWVKANGMKAGDVFKVYLGQHLVDTSIARDGMFTVAISPEFTSKVGAVDISIMNFRTGQKFKIGNFTIKNQTGTMER